MIKLNIGCGNDRKEGYVNIDIASAANPDVVLDIEDGLFIYADDSCVEIIAENVLTQISSPQIFLKVMNEFHRVLVHGGTLVVRVPNAKDICAFQDPMDQRRFTDQTFTYMEFGHRRYTQYGKHYGFFPWTVFLAEDNDRQMMFHMNPVKPKTR